MRNQTIQFIVMKIKLSELGEVTYPSGNWTSYVIIVEGYKSKLAKVLKRLRDIAI